jgi:lipoyl(octanoyl) transferase
MSTPGGEHSRDELWVCQLGTMPYLQALAIQQDIRARRQADELPDTLLLLEHPPVYTCGRRSRADELALGKAFYRERGIDVLDTDRGGRVTYHGPGQLVGYPIVRVRDVGAHLRTIEAAIVSALADEGIDARSRCAEGPDYTGVWVEDRKIASIGVHLSRGVTTHGFAINVDNDLDPFSWIVACGLPDVTMTSVAHELPSGRELDASGFRRRVIDQFGDAHGRRTRVVSPQRLGIETVAPPQPAPTRGRTPRASHHGGEPACADATQENAILHSASLVRAHEAAV